jgi:hypothetical protein
MINLKTHIEPCDIYSVKKLYDDGYVVSTETGEAILDKEQLSAWIIYIRNWIIMNRGNIMDAPNVQLWKINN